MAARNKRTHDYKTRQKIQTTQLVKRLTAHALSDEEVMTTSQVRAAEILLRKTLPDTQCITVDAQVTNTIEDFVTGAVKQQHDSSAETHIH